MQKPPIVDDHYGSWKLYIIINSTGASISEASRILYHQYCFTPAFNLMERVLSTSLRTGINNAKKLLKNV